MVQEIGICFEVQVPPFARKSPVANINDPPIRPRLEVDDEIDAFAIDAVHLATAKDHLTRSLGGLALAACETERREDRIENRGDRVNRTRVGWQGKR